MFVKLHTLHDTPFLVDLDSILYAGTDTPANKTYIKFKNRSMIYVKETLSQLEAIIASQIGLVALNNEDS
jgi:hypothetical protein